MNLREYQKPKKNHLLRFTETRQGKKIYEYNSITGELRTLQNPNENILHSKHTIICIANNDSKMFTLIDKHIFTAWKELIDNTTYSDTIFEDI